MNESRKRGPSNHQCPNNSASNGTDDDRFEIRFANFGQLPSPLLEIMSGVRVRHFFGRRAIVKFLLVAATGDAVIFDADKFAHAARDKIDIFERKIESDVAIEIPIGRIARITFLRAPNLTARFAIARENGRPGRGKIRRVNRAARTRFAEHHAVRVENGPADVRFL